MDVGRLGRHGVKFWIGKAQGTGKTMIPHFTSLIIYLHPDHVICSITWLACRYGSTAVR